MSIRPRRRGASRPKPWRERADKRVAQPPAMHVNDLLKLAVENGASDLHLKVGSYPMMRVRGELTPATQEKRLDHEDVVAMSAAVMSTVQRQKFKDAQEVDLAYSVPGLGRFQIGRAHV